MEGHGAQTHMQGNPEWYVVRAKPRREQFAQGQLTRRGVETFLPRIRERARMHTEPIVAPLFPGYLFARVDLLTQYTSVIWAPGVRNMVAFGDVPVAVDRKVIDFLQERCGGEGIVQVLLSFHNGDTVRVTSGPLEGLVGVVQGESCGRDRVHLLMEMLRRCIRVSVPTELLERLIN